MTIDKSQKTMVRRKRKRIFKAVFMVCLAVFCLGIIFRAVISSLELRAVIIIHEEKNKGTPFPSLSSSSLFRENKVR